MWDHASPFIWCQHQLNRPLATHTWSYTYKGGVTCRLNTLLGSNTKAHPINPNSCKQLWHVIYKRGQSSEFGLFPINVSHSLLQIFRRFCCFRWDRSQKPYQPLSHILVFSLPMNLSVKVLRPHFPFSDPLDSGMEKERRVFLNSELETQTQRHRILSLPPRSPLSLVIHEDGAVVEVVRSFS